MAGHSIDVMHYTIWHENVNGGGFHASRKTANHKFVFENFKKKFVVGQLFGKPWCWESSVFSDSETLFKYENWLE